MLCHLCFWHNFIPFSFFFSGVFAAQSCLFWGSPFYIEPYFTLPCRSWHLGCQLHPDPHPDPFRWCHICQPKFGSYGHSIGHYPTTIRYPCKYIDNSLGFFFVLDIMMLCHLIYYNKKWFLLWLILDICFWHNFIPFSFLSFFLFRCLCCSELPLLRITFLYWTIFYVALQELALGLPVTSRSPPWSI